MNTVKAFDEFDARLYHTPELDDQLYISELCQEIDRKLQESQEMAILVFLYQYIKALIKQRKLDPVGTLLETVGNYDFGANNEQMQIYVRFMKAQLCQAQGRKKEATALYDQVKREPAYFEKIGFRNVVAVCYKELGNFDFAQGMFRDAIEHYEQAINQLKLNKDSEYMLAVLMFNMSLCHYRLKNFKKAMEHLDKVIPLARDTSNSLLLLDALIMKAALLTEYKKFNESNEYLNWAYEIAERNHHVRSINKIWNNWGHNFFHLQQFMLAEQSFQQALTLGDQLQNELDNVFSKLMLAKTWIAQGRSAKAKQLLRSIHEKLTDHSQQPLLLIDCLELLEEVEDNPRQKREYLHQAFQLAKKHKNYQKMSNLQKKLKKK